MAVQAAGEPSQTVGINNICHKGSKNKHLAPEGLVPIMNTCTTVQVFLGFCQRLCYDLSMKDQKIEWEGPEYVAPKRSPLWYVITIILGLGLIALLVIAQLIWGWENMWTVIALIAVVMVAVIMRGTVQPKMVKYSIDANGITEGEKLRPFAEFKAFGVVRQGDTFFVSLRPAKRFGMRMTVVIPGDKGEQIVDVLGKQMQMEEVKEDFVDKLVNILKI